MANLDSVHLQAAINPADKLIAEENTTAKNDTNKSFLDAAWATTKSAGREAQFIVGSVAGAAQEAVSNVTTYDVAKNVGLGIVFGVIGARYSLPGLAKTATSALVLGNVVSDVVDNKWAATFNAAADAWRSDKNLKADIEVGKRGVGHSIVDNAGLFLGMKAGAKVTELATANLGLISRVNALAATMARGNFSSMALSSAEAKVPNLSRPVEGDSFKYFAHSRSSAKPQIYRWPDNGKPLAGQELADVQRLDESGVWHPNHREGLLREFTKGWFNERTDQIPPGETKATIEKWLSR